MLVSKAQWFVQNLTIFFVFQFNSNTVEVNMTKIIISDIKKHLQLILILSDFLQNFNFPSRRWNQNYLMFGLYKKLSRPQI